MTGKDLASQRLIRLPDSSVADCVLFIKKTQPIHIFGSVSIRKLVGSLSVDGHEIAGDDWYFLCAYSPNLITLKSRLSKPRIDWRKTRLSSVLNDVYSDENKSLIEKYSKKLNDVRCIVLLKSTSVIPNPNDLFDITNIMGIDQFDKQHKGIHEKTSDLNFTVFLDVPPCLSPLITSSGWSDIPGSIQSQSTKDSSPIILVCGGKGVGKSTFGRYLVNKLLNTEKHLWFLETDVGQSEFTPPGILSLNLINKPVFGPPFSHLSTPQKACFVGDFSPKDCPNSYVFFINQLNQFYKDNYDGTPLVVNTHGWIKGMGFRILLEIIRIVQPTHIIQISSESEPTKNLATLDKALITNEDGWDYWQDKDRSKTEKDWECSPTIYQLSAFIPDSDLSQKNKLTSKDLRSLSLISYFGSLKSSWDNASTNNDILNHCPIYSQKISDVQIYNVCDHVPESEILYAINGSVVGLVKEEKEENMNHSKINASRVKSDIPFGEYIGLGIVRNIDPEAGVLFILSPVSSDKISEVNVLIKGRLEIPDALLKKRKFETVPYMTSEFTYNHKGSGRKKIRYNLLRQKSRSPHPPDNKKLSTAGIQLKSINVQLTGFADTP